MGGPWAKDWQKDCQEDWPQDWQQARASGGWLVLAGSGESPPPLPPPALLPAGPGLVIGSGGSTGGRRWCLQPWSHLEASAAASGQWLVAQGLEPARCLHLNPLPQHHVSGLMPAVRAEQWGCAELRLPPALMRDPRALAAAVALPQHQQPLIALVPTQLQRLMAAPEGIAWLRQMAVIWVGGAALPEQLATRARQQGLRLAPCYGATETAAMVCALAPDQFLAGRQGCGPPLADVQLRLDAASGAVEVRTPRLSPGWLGERGLVPLPTTAAGWWRSGDAGRLQPEGLEIRGRLDGAINSGGETVFPEQLEQRLQLAATQLPLAAVLLLAEPHPEWGQILVALVRAQACADADTLIAALQNITQTWPAAERPRRWCNCPTLATTSSGKWQRGQWRAWLAGLAG
jgi:O-succinylbenzoic acid--CoA ligase